MWTKRNDHPPKVNMFFFIKTFMSKKGGFEKKVKSLIILLIILYPPKTFHQTKLITSYSAMGPCLFLLEHLFCFSHRKTHLTMSTDTASLKICLLETLNFMATLTFSTWCRLKSSKDEFNNQSQSYTLGRLRGPWCNML